LTGDGCSVERQPFRVLGRGPARHEHRVLGHSVGTHATLDEIEMQVDETAHLDRTAEGDFAVALREVEIADGKVRSGNENRVKDTGSSREVLDVLISTVLPRWRGPGSLPGHTVEIVAVQTTQNRVLRFRRQGQRGNAIGIRR